jgi:hypothetical protein
MRVEGQLLQQEPSGTIGYSESSVLANQWIAGQFFVTSHTEGATAVGAIDAFARLFERVRLTTTYKFGRLNLADELADRLICEFGATTGVSTVYGSSDFSATTEPSRSVNDEVKTSDQVSEIISWLGLTNDQLSQITGIGRSTLFYWRRSGSAPRATNARNIDRLHSLASLLVKRFGIKGAQSWLHNGPSRPWDYLIEGEIASVEDLARGALFGQNGRNYAVSPTIGADDLPPAAAPGKSSLVRSSRRPKKGRLER